MSIYFYIILICILTKLCLCSDWNYNEHGPDIWSELNSNYRSCNGTRQSPINIKTKCAIYKNFDSFKFTDSHSDEINFLITNNGHTITLEIDNPQLSIQGGDLNGIFYFENVHLHWGPNYNTGSEHQM